jgi:hypothetical protein
MTNISIEYDGKWPSLCFGNLIVTIDEISWDFGRHALLSGGSVWFDEDYSNAHVEEGEWSIDDDSWPENFPENLKQAVIDEVNSSIPYGCCGGCI